MLVVELSKQGPSNPIRNGNNNCNQDNPLENRPELDDANNDPKSEEDNCKKQKRT